MNKPASQLTRRQAKRVARERAMQASQLSDMRARQQRATAIKPGRRPNINIYIPAVDEAEAEAIRLAVMTREEQIARWKVEREQNKALRKQEQRTKRSGFVYMIGCSELQCYKIGVTCRKTPDKRIDAIRYIVPFDLDFMKTWTCPDVYATETRLHRILARWHKKGEWFSFAPDVLPVAIREVEEHITPHTINS